MMNPKTARDAFDAGTKAGDAPEIKIGIRNEDEGIKGWRNWVTYFYITVGDTMFSIHNYEEYDPREKRAYFDINESSVRNGLSGIFGNNKAVVDRLYGHVLDAIHDHIRNDPAYLSKHGPNAGELRITSIRAEKEHLARFQKRRESLSAQPIDTEGGLPHHKIQ